MMGPEDNPMDDAVELDLCKEEIKQLQAKLEKVKLDRNLLAMYSYYVSTQVSCGKMPWKLARWRTEIDKAKQASGGG